MCLKPLDLDLNQSEVSCVSAEEDDTELLVHDSDPSSLPSNTNTVGGVLSVKQLVLRRGLTLLIMILILIAGIVL